MSEPKIEGYQFKPGFKKISPERVKSNKPNFELVVISNPTRARSKPSTGWVCR